MVTTILHFWLSLFYTYDGVLSLYDRYNYITMYRNNMYIYTIYYYYIFIIIILSGIHRYDSVFFITLSLSGRPENDLHYFDVEASPPAPCFAGLLGAAVTMGFFTPPNCCVFMGKSSWRVWSLVMVKRCQKHIHFHLQWFFAAVSKFLLWNLRFVSSSAFHRYFSTPDLLEDICSVQTNHFQNSDVCQQNPVVSTSTRSDLVQTEEPFFRSPTAGLPSPCAAVH